MNMVEIKINVTDKELEILKKASEEMGMDLDNFILYCIKKTLFDIKGHYS